ncbi:MAG: rhomboid family intramembrane serine protease [Planctomycetota bacterium]
MTEPATPENPTPGEPDKPADAQAEDQPLPSLDDAPVVKWLLILNIVVYVLNDSIGTVQGRLAGKWGQYDLLTFFGSFTIPQGINGFQLWRLFSYQFLHANLVHIGLNMMALFVFGPMLEQWWGRRRFLAFYLLCGACGAWLMALFAYTPLVDGRTAWLVGASGSIFGILVGVAMAYPTVEVKLILPPMWVTVRRLAMVFLLLSVAQILFGFNTGGNLAHLGGALFGYFLMQRPWSLDFADKRAPKLDPPGKPTHDKTPADPPAEKDPNAKAE